LTVQFFLPSLLALNDTSNAGSEKNTESPFSLHSVTEFFRLRFYIPGLPVIFLRLNHLKETCYHPFVPPTPAKPLAWGLGHYLEW
jgi:hypothetical protein